jgi:thiol:disulfide interchange protein
MPFVRPHRVSKILTVLVTFALAAVALAVPTRSAEHDIYPAPDQAKTDLAAALTAAAATHKRVILDFGGNWCPDCRVLDLYFHDSVNRPILDANFILVHVNVGRVNENLEIAERYGIPLRKGVPALAVLGERGELLYSQKSGEFEAMRGMQSSAVTAFLVRWKRPSA